MKKTIALLTLMVSLGVSTSHAKWGAPALVWVKVKNRTPWKLDIWWKGNRAHGDEVNAVALLPYEGQLKRGLVGQAKAEKIFLIRKSEGAMNGPLFVSREQVSTKKGAMGAENTFYDIFETDPNSYFFPVNQQGTIYRVLTLTKDASGTGIRVRQTYPDPSSVFDPLQIFSSKTKHVPMKRKRVFITG